MMTKDNKEVENMKPEESPYLEEPETFDPTEKNRDENYGGGGNKDDSKK